MEINNRK